MNMKNIIAMMTLSLTVAAGADPILNTENDIYYEEIDQAGNWDAGTWDGAKASAETLSYEGMTGQLAIVDSDATRQFLVDNVLGGEWNIDWVGAYQSDLTLYNVDGTDFNTSALSDNFYSVDPEPGDYGVAIQGPGYSGTLRSYEASFDGVGDFVVEYAVPEPVSVAMLAVISLGVFIRRRFFA